MKRNFLHTAKDRLFAKLGSIRANPRQIAGGYALGFFLGTTPLVGMKTWIALLASSLLGWSRPAAVIGVFHINAFTGPIFYTLAFGLGRLVLGTDVHFVFPEELGLGAVFKAFMGNSHIFFTLLTGGLLLGIPGTIFLYGASYRIVKRLHLTPKEEDAVE
ncbi:MAG: DUF2062 domain-containing protein [Saprospirales bacterium]|nr:DUF2062 domain-containing protein [Saprospirales bacterium]MBK8491371.1 DUF2062 domain-containing protein [Saprospirales bacterium]